VATYEHWDSNIFDFRLLMWNWIDACQPLVGARPRKHRDCGFCHRTGRLIFVCSSNLFWLLEIAHTLAPPLTPAHHLNFTYCSGQFRIRRYKGRAKGDGMADDKGVIGLKIKAFALQVTD
jgi:hypothetical protein